MTITSPPPRIDSYAVVAGGAGIAVSNNASAQTFRFDTAGRTWSEAGDWVLPFTRLADYVPEHKLWFGISPAEDGHRFCAANLAASPVVHGLWKGVRRASPGVERCGGLRRAPGLLQVLHRQVLLDW